MDNLVIDDSDKICEDVSKDIGGDIGGDVSKDIIRDIDWDVSRDISRDISRDRWRSKKRYYVDKLKDDVNENKFINANKSIEGKNMRTRNTRYAITLKEYKKICTRIDLCEYPWQIASFLHTII